MPKSKRKSFGGRWEDRKRVETRTDPDQHDDSITICHDAQPMATEVQEHNTSSEWRQAASSISRQMPSTTSTQTASTANPVQNDNRVNDNSMTISHDAQLMATEVQAHNTSSESSQASSSISRQMPSTTSTQTASTANPVQNDYRVNDNSMTISHDAQLMATEVQAHNTSSESSQASSSISRQTPTTTSTQTTSTANTSRLPNGSTYRARSHDLSFEAFHLGQMNVMCEHCRALRFPKESQNCCHNGKVSLPPPSPYPDEMKELFSNTTPNSRKFLKNIRFYNSSFSFASMGAMMAPPPGNGPYCFRIHGQLYHNVYPLHPAPGEQPVHGQLYIIDGQQATDCRLSHPQNQDCNKDTMNIIQTTLDRINPYVTAYKQMDQVEREAGSNNDVKLIFKRNKDKKRYNAPTHDEVAAVFIGEEGIPPAERDIVVYPHNQPKKRISHLSSHIDPMTYPLLFPSGDPGWIMGAHHNSQFRTPTRNTITLLQYYSHQLAIRAQFSAVHRAGKLLQQYIVDAYVKTEGSRLSYLRANQHQLRVEKYKGLMDHLSSQAETMDIPLGKVVILPATFQGSPRAMQQNYQDAMAIVAKYGKPDLFLTFTCNPKWKEIKDNLLPGQQSADRPDLVARVFHLKLKELLKDICVRNVLGKGVAWTHVIEFQKRGLPHCHLLIILSQESKLRDPVDVDSLISAQIPDCREDEELYNIVKSTMIHGPCGVMNTKSVCMENGECTKGFPKSFQHNTIIDDGYPKYCRPDNGRTMPVRGQEVDNRWIVPYCPYLTKKYQAHINLEACMSIKSVKYLYKYIYKGHDCASLEIQHPRELNHDEISSFIDTRYVSAPEGIWRLSEYSMHGSSHSVVRLPVHLPDQHMVYFQEGKEEEALTRASDGRTRLTAWFELNQKDVSAQQYLYPDIPSHYVYDQRKKEWKPRKRSSKMISRMYTVNPKDQERFFLRLLLLHVSGATNYADMKTVDGVELETFKEACKKRNLLEDDNAWNQALTDATQLKMPSQLRFMFATIIAFNHPADPLKLWEQHKKALSEDYMRNIPDHLAEQHALQQIDSILRPSGLRCSTLGLPIEDDFISTSVATEDNLLDDTTLQLNADQQHIVTEIMATLDDINANTEPQPRAFFMDGPGGTGKTTVYNRLISTFFEKGLKVSATAYTGIAATLLHKGQTVHSYFKLPVPVIEGSTCNITLHSDKARDIKSTSLFIIDEASMIPKHALNAIDILLQDIMRNKVPFGGKIFLLGGDFRQVLPVIPRSRPITLIENTIKKSKVFGVFTQFQLTQNMRAEREQQEFAEWILSIGDGRTPNSTTLPQDYVIIPDKITTSDIVEDMYSDPTLILSSNKEAILTPKNEATFEINDKILKKMPGEMKTYCSADTIRCDDTAEVENFPIEFINSITPSGMPQHRLHLKINAIIMLLRNLDIRQGLCNGTRLRVKHLYNNVIDAEVITTGKRVLIPRIRLSPSDTNLPFVLQRCQFPIRVAFCMTINKSQGQTFDRVGVYLPEPVFTHGQLYVALSRAKSFHAIKIQIDNTATGTQGVTADFKYTKNVVFHDVL